MSVSIENQEMGRIEFEIYIVDGKLRHIIRGMVEKITWVKIYNDGSLQDSSNASKVKWYCFVNNHSARK